MANLAEKYVFERLAMLEKEHDEHLKGSSANDKPEPVAKDLNGDDIYIGGTVWFDDEEYLVRAYKPASANNNERILVTCCDVWETPIWLYFGGHDVTVRNPNAQVVDPRSSL
jgi:hypothetical protein